MAQFLVFKDISQQQCATLNVDTLTQLIAKQHSAFNTQQHSLIANTIHDIIYSCDAPQWSYDKISVIIAIVSRLIFQLTYKVSPSMTADYMNQHITLSYDTMNQLLLRHAINRSPYAMALFSLPEMEIIHRTICDVFFRHVTILLYALIKDKNDTEWFIFKQELIKNNNKLKCPFCKESRCSVVNKNESKQQQEQEQEQQQQQQTLPAQNSNTVTHTIIKHQDKHYQITYYACPQCLIQLPVADEVEAPIIASTEHQHQEEQNNNNSESPVEAAQDVVQEHAEAVPASVAAEHAAPAPSAHPSRASTPATVERPSSSAASKQPSRPSSRAS